jgi:prepilin-type N-terminal cleavage/methylation domain-containing protein
MSVSALRREDGFSLPELLIALSIALIISLATFSLVELTMKKSGEVSARVNASQRGRLAMDTITRELRSQVCISSKTPAMYLANTNETAFYVDFTDQSSTDTPPSLNRLSYDAASKTIVEYRTKGTSNHATPPTFNYDFNSAALNSHKVLLDNAVPYQGLPIFRYYAYNNLTPPRPDVLLSTAGGPLAAADLARVARVVVTYRARGTDRNNDVGSIVMQDEVYVRSADPNDPAPTPTCS